VRHAKRLARLYLSMNKNVNVPKQLNLNKK
jgi:hypothetical protein